MEITDNTTYHFVGIKGTGMASLAMILNDLGYKVQGSDIEKHTFTQDTLEKVGIKILPFSEDNIHEGLSIIRGNAYNKNNNVEIKKALDMGMEVSSYPDFVEKLIEKCTSIGVAGSHGKTTTTGLLAHVLSGVDKTSYLIGDGTGHGEKDSKFFVFEADEYRRHFLAYHPDYMIMTNIDFDHPDYFSDINDVFEAFQQSANQVKKAIFAWGDDENLKKLSANVPIYYYGTNDSDDFQAVNIQKTTHGSAFDVMHDGKKIGSYEVPMYGTHNILNATAVIAVCYMENIDNDAINAEFSTYQGVKRRFSEKDMKDMVIIDDYAHHPHEIKATIDATRQKYPDKEVVAVFQPHTYSRTKALMDGFAESLDLADHVYLTEIFASAREESGDVSSEDLGKKIKHGGEVLSEDDMSPLLQYHDAVVVFMGAGDIQKYEKAYENLLMKDHSHK